jgi:hypothetical protein
LEGGARTAGYGKTRLVNLEQQLILPPFFVISAIIKEK